MVFSGSGHSTVSEDWIRSHFGDWPRDAVKSMVLFGQLNLFDCVQSLQDGRKDVKSMNRDWERFEVTKQLTCETNMDSRIRAGIDNPPCIEHIFKSGPDLDEETNWNQHPIIGKLGNRKRKIDETVEGNIDDHFDEGIEEEIEEPDDQLEDREDYYAEGEDRADV
ncbi:hypothetical protein BJ742DRAFT_735067 [Cladochytrium replicatum]|nr:hypothetical protein BJ742DRAFT_735067 [Cladochytrium replicatum]